MAARWLAPLWSEQEFGYNRGIRRIENVLLDGASAQLPRYFSDTDKVQDLESRLLTCMVELQGFKREDMVKTAISQVQVSVDGTFIGIALYGGSRPDVCAIYPGRPGWRKHLLEFL